MAEDIKECSLCKSFTEDDPALYELKDYEAMTNYGKCEQTGKRHSKYDDCDCDNFEAKDA